MRRVLVPLDGTDLAASILPDARRLAGARGQLVLRMERAAPVPAGRPTAPDGFDTFRQLRDRSRPASS